MTDSAEEGDPVHASSRPRIVAYSGWHTVVHGTGAFVRTGVLSDVRPEVGRVTVWWQGRSGGGSWQALSLSGTGPLAILGRPGGPRRLLLLDSNGFRHRLVIDRERSRLSPPLGRRVAIAADAVIQGGGAVCAGGRGRTVTIAVNPDAPAPRCMEVSPHQGLRAVNRTARYGQRGHSIRVAFAGRAERLGVGDAAVFRRPVGEYLAPGIHYLEISGHGHTIRGEVWVRHMPAHRMNVRREDGPGPRAYAYLFSRFAHRPSVRNAPFDTPVSLGLGGRYVRTLDGDDRVDPQKWRLSLRGYAEASGTISALRLLLDNARDAHVSNRPPPPCAVHTDPGLRLTGGGRLVRIQPRLRATSCIEWWSVDLFVNDVGQVVGVNVNLGAP
jgi:hypothetical protein